MKVQKIQLYSNHYNYLIIDDDYHPLVYPGKYLKYLDNIRKSQNTLRTYAFGLKLFYEFIYGEEIELEDVGIYELSNFVIWLFNPNESVKIIPKNVTESKRTAATVNLYITVVNNYYSFLYANDFIKENKTSKSYTLMSNKYKSYKGFLYHISKNSSSFKNTLKIKTKKKRTKSLTKEDVAKVISETTNIRDAFLISLLYNTGLRIGEALSLQHVDIKPYSNGIYKIVLADRTDTVNETYNKTGIREVMIGQELLDLYDDYCYFLECKLGIMNDYVFVKLTGDNVGQPLEMQNISHLFRTLKKKTGISDLHPHILRATNGTIAYETTKNIEYVRENLGHKDIQTTIDSYVFTSDNAKVKEWSKVSESLKLF